LSGPILDKDLVGFFSCKHESLIKNILDEIPKKYTITVYSNFKIFGTDLIEATLL